MAFPPLDPRRLLACVLAPSCSPAFNEHPGLTNTVPDPHCATAGRAHLDEEVAQGVLDYPADTRKVFAQAICGITDPTEEFENDMTLGAGAMAYVLLAVSCGPGWPWLLCWGAAVSMLGL